MKKDTPSKKEITLIDIAKDAEPHDDKTGSALGLQMNKDINRLCQELSVSSSDFNATDWLDSLSSYIATHDRLLYSNISNYIFTLSDQEFATFLTNLENVTERQVFLKKINAGSDDTLYRVVMKFYDHVNLAHRQFQMFTGREGDLERTIDRKLDAALATTTKELTSQLVGLVSIFTALSFIVFGGISSLDSIFSHLASAKDSIFPVIIVAAAWSFCMLNLLFAFMYFVLRITKLALPLKPGSNVVQRYPVIFLANYILFAIILVCLGLWAAERYGIGVEYFYAVTKDYNSCSFVIGGVLIAAIVFLTGRFLWSKYTEPYDS